MATPEISHGRLIGLEIGHYRIAEMIGAGGMGEVYRARDEHLDREVAIKVLPAGSLPDEASRKRFRNEALTLSKLNHPNIATIYDFDTQQGMDFLVMEYIDGATLSTCLENGPLAENEVIGLGAQLAEGLAAAHQRGIVHRDLKPANLRLTEDGRLKILDFGLAKLRVATSSTAATVSASATDGIAGTLPYMAPEQLLGDAIDARTDIHAAGSVLYEMATGKGPFADTESSQIVGAILRAAPRPVSALNPAVSAGLQRVVSKCLEKEPSRRYQSAEDLGLALRRIGTAAEAISEERGGPWHRSRRWWRGVGAALFFAFVAAGTLLMHSLNSRHHLTASDTVVLADFVNKTGDAVFDDTLKQALATELGQSPFLKMVPDQKISSTLKLMGRSASEPITMTVGRELCLRTGSKAVIDGSISPLGSHYLIALNALACSTGDVLAKEEGESASKEQVLATLRGASSRFRVKLGESLPSVKKYDVPYEAATSSLEALKTFTIGSKVLAEQGTAPSIPFFKRAIELDPNFPLAYANLATAYRNLGEPSLSVYYATKAYQLRDRSTELERLEIEAAYFDAIGQMEKEIQTYKVWEGVDPTNPVPHANLGANYASLGQFDKALQESQSALRLEPLNVVRYANLGMAYMYLNRLDEAKAVLDQALARKLDSIDVRAVLYAVAFLRGTQQEMEQQVAWSAGKPGEEDVLLSMQSDTEGYFGRMRNAREISRRAVASATRADSKESAASWQVNAALREAEIGNVAAARQGVASALAMSKGRDVKLVAALTLARAGEVAQAEAFARELAKDQPTNTMYELYWLPTIQAAIEVSRKNPSAAIAALQSSGPYELGSAGGTGSLYPVYVRGQAYLLEHNGTAAIAEFQKMFNHRGIVLNTITGAIAFLQIARAYALVGDHAKAKGAYEAFFSLWKNADRDLLVLKQAQAEYAKLRP